MESAERRAMADGNDRRAFEALQQQAVKRRLGRFIKGSRRLVEEKIVRRLQQHAGDRPAGPTTRGNATPHPYRPSQCRAMRWPCGRLGHYLDRLVEVAAGRDPGPDPWHGRTGNE